MFLNIFKTRYIVYILLISITGWFLFTFLQTKQNAIMYQYFIEKPTSYNLERAERLATSIYKSFKKEVPAPSSSAIKSFITKYNDIPFLSVNFIYEDKSGTMKSVVENINETDILNAEYVYPVRYGNREIGTLLVYDINKEYKKGLEEYKNMLYITRIFFALFLLFLIYILIYREYSTSIEGKKRIAEYQATHDGLTGLHTHKYFKEHLEEELKRTQRYHRPISLIMCDVDFFKKFNDTYGHLAGDEILRKVGQIIQSNVRSTDVVARYGGEEFAILLIEANIKNAENVAKRLKILTEKTIEVADRIKESVEHTNIEVNHTKVHVTLSMGICAYSGEEEQNIEGVINEADGALYKSKEHGRNRITIFDPDAKEFKELSSG